MRRFASAGIKQSEDATSKMHELNRGWPCRKETRVLARIAPPD